MSGVLENCHHGTRPSPSTDTGGTVDVALGGVGEGVLGKVRSAVDFELY